MLIKNRWSWGRQLQWGIFLFLIFIFLNFFFYDTTETFKGLWSLLFSIISLCIFIVSAGTTKLLLAKIKMTKSIAIWCGLCIFIFVIEMLVYNIPQNIYIVITSKYFWTNSFDALSAAIFEESICRGLLFSSFIGLGVYRGTKLNITKSAIYSSLLFSSFHFMNFLSGSANIVLQQMFSAVAIGVFFVMIRVLTNGILWPIVIHFLLDWGPLVSYSYNGTSNWGITLIIFTLILTLSIKSLITIEHQIAS